MPACSNIFIMRRDLAAFACLSGVFAADKPNKDGADMVIS